MLTKLTNRVVHPPVPAVAGRSYSKTCPPPAPPPVPHQWETKYLCGTATHYLLLSGNQVVGYSTAYLISYNGTIVLDQVVDTIVDPTQPPDHSQLAFEEPFCTHVRVYV